MEQPTQAEMESMDWQQLFWVCWQSLVEMESKYDGLCARIAEEKRAIARAGAEARGEGEAQRLALTEMRKEGMSYSDIAARVGTTYQRVYMIIHGVEHLKGKNR
jgi:hypothetical protein